MDKKEERATDEDFQKLEITLKEIKEAEEKVKNIKKKYNLQRNRNGK